ncbi:MAG: LptF/LptG family permease [Opitutales bacterium]
MNLLHRYVFKQVLLAGLFSVALLVFVMVTVNALRDIIEPLAAGQLTWWAASQIMVRIIPYMVSFALPLGLLTGVLLVYGRLSANREITAMKAAGLSLYQIAAPPVVVAILGVVFATVVNFFYSPLAKTAYKSELANIARENPLRLIRPGVFIKDFSEAIFFVEERTDEALFGVHVWRLDEAGKLQAYLVGQRGEIELSEDESKILLSLHDVVAEARLGDEAELPDAPPAPAAETTRSPPEEGASEPGMLILLDAETVPFALPLSELLGLGEVERKLSMLTFDELISRERELGVQASQLGTEAAERDHLRVRMRIHENFSLSFAVLSMTLVAVPLGIRVSRKETYANLAIALVLAMSFYLSLFAIKLLEENPALRPDLLIWLPNLVFQGLGLWLLWRASRN